MVIIKSSITVKHLISSIGGAIESEEVAFDPRDEVYEYDIEKETWSLVGRMQHKRAKHAVSLIKTDNIVEFCDEVAALSNTTESSGSSDTKDLKSKILILLSLMLLGVNLF